MENKKQRISGRTPSSSTTIVTKPRVVVPTKQGPQRQPLAEIDLNEASRRPPKTTSTDDDESHVDDEDGNPSESFEGDDVLWFGTKRRQYQASGPGHQAVLKKTIPYLQGLIMTGGGGRFCSPWPEQNVAKLNIVMNEAWTYVCRQLAHGHSRRPPGVDEIPEPHEARKV